MTLTVGLVIPEALSSAETIAYATSAEDAGIESVWFTEIDREAMSRAAFVAGATSRVRVGTAVSLWTRSAVTAATAAAELNQLSSGRFTYGLGVGTQWHDENWYHMGYDKPAARLSEYVKLIRGIWETNASAEAPFSFEGDYFSIQHYQQVAYDNPPPLYIAAVGPAMLRLAGRSADGIIYNPASTPWTTREFSQQHVAAGAASAGRRPEDLTRAAVIRCAVNSDASLARQWLRQDIAEYGQYPTHQETYERHGFGTEAKAIAEAMLAGDKNAAADAVSEEMVETFGLACAPGEERKRLEVWDGLIDHAILMPAMSGMTSEEVTANCAAVRDAFAG